MDSYASEPNALIEHLFQDIHPKTLSIDSRKKLGIADTSYVYGEFSPESIVELMQEFKRDEHHVFYDLGSGVGKIVFTAALFFTFDKIVGIEYLDLLHEAATQVLNRTKSVSSDVNRALNRVEFVNADLLKYDFSEADIVLVNAVCFPTSLMEKLVRKLDDLKPGSLVITLAQALPSKDFEVKFSKLYAASWGKTMAFVQERVS